MNLSFSMSFPYFANMAARRKSFQALRHVIRIQLTILIIGISWAAVSALAAPPIGPGRILSHGVPSKVSENARFHPVSPSNLTRKGVIRLEVGGQQCTAAYVSDQAHAMTAAHCLEVCVKSPSDFLQGPVRCLATPRAYPSRVAASRDGLL